VPARTEFWVSRGPANGLAVLALHCGVSGRNQTLVPRVRPVRIARKRSGESPIPRHDMAVDCRTHEIELGDRSMSPTSDTFGDLPTVGISAAT
jgi:hypothetical protein